MSVERLYPGVYVTELPAEPHPIDGVATSSGADTHAPQWTQGHAHDPGLTLSQLMAFLGEATSYRAGRAAADEPRIDLATLVSRYIGETEKNIEAMFGRAERASAVLHFDESTSLFGDDRP